MSAGTIFAMSGNDIIMGKNSYIGPTDPQVPNKDWFYVPAQAILTLIDEIQKRQSLGLDWFDLQDEFVASENRTRKLLDKL